MRLAIYGAQGIALGAWKALRAIFPEKEILCFLVTQMGRNPSVLEGVPVMELQEFADRTDHLDDVEVLIGVPENVMGEIEGSLERAGIRHYVRLDSRRWAEMARNAFIKSGTHLPLAAYPVGCRKAGLHIFKMVHVKDSALKTQLQDPGYLSTLQVGAALSRKMDVDMWDDSGDHISEKNGNYSELTGLYWVWKQYLCARDDDGYYGLAHYRRLLDLSEDEILRLWDNGIDAVLPYPMPYAPDIGAHHERYLSGEEWAAVRKALREVSPEYDRDFDGILRQEYLYNYNIILAKRSVLEGYCAWLFPILFRIEEIHDPEGKRAPNRYIGYVAESLETLYFTRNRKRMRIAHAGCRFLA